MLNERVLPIDLHLRALFQVTSTADSLGPTLFEFCLHDRFSACCKSLTDQRVQPPTTTTAVCRRSCRRHVHEEKTPAWTSLCTRRLVDDLVEMRKFDNNNVAGSMSDRLNPCFVLVLRGLSCEPTRLSDYVSGRRNVAMDMGGGFNAAARSRSCPDQPVKCLETGPGSISFRATGGQPLRGRLTHAKRNRRICHCQHQTVLWKLCRTPAWVGLIHQGGNDTLLATDDNHRAKAGSSRAKRPIVAQHLSNPPQTFPLPLCHFCAQIISAVCSGHTNRGTLAAASSNARSTGHDDFAHPRSRINLNCSGMVADSS